MIAPARRIKALNLLERMKRHEMEDDLRALADLNARIANGRAERDVLKDRLQSETQVTEPGAMPYVAGFMRAMRDEIAKVDAQLEDLGRQSDALDDVVRERFREAKTFASVADRLRDQQRVAAQMREAKDNDEIALTRWQRRTG